MGVTVLHQIFDLTEDDLAALFTSRNVDGVPVRTCGASGSGHRILLLCAVPISAVGKDWTRVCTWSLACTNQSDDWKNFD